MMKIDYAKLDKVQGRRWMVRFDLPSQTLADWTDESVGELIEQALGRWDYIGDLERGEKDGRYHVQAYMETPDDAPTRLGAIVRAIRKRTDSDGKMVSVNVERAHKDAAHCVAYVTKPNTKIWGAYTNREHWPELDDAADDSPITRGDLYRSIIDEGQSVQDILRDERMAVAASSCLSWLRSVQRRRDADRHSQSERRPIESLYIYGASGVGKSTVAREWLSKQCGEGGFFVVSDYKRDPFGGYEGEKGLLLDDLRLPSRFLDLQSFLQLADGFQLQLSRRYENTWAAYEHLVMTSNRSPNEQWRAIVEDAPWGAKPGVEERCAFMRRLGRVLHVQRGGRVVDETELYAGNLAAGAVVSLDALEAALVEGSAGEVRAEDLL